MGMAPALTPEVEFLLTSFQVPVAAAVAPTAVALRENAHANKSITGLCSMTLNSSSGHKI
ncbi:hypothetical protein PV08_00458 [Exophiala spinifera]|uniref:Uncharacterized protein n=1 Tax=Exophiala spinifera TaxID=91928 RepID=A0A0D2BLR6_9EURO|nr:uncharacterized protein PV08_00458 [Exophiala spinifera]KIW19883.1 hypothetical protein PV08_00458 [Exophiala spinifera]